MRTIEFDVIINGKSVKVELRSDFGGPEGWYINIDGYHQGMLYHRDGIWRAHLNLRSFLTGDDITILGEIIDREIR